jgi:hypothetical protein
MIQTLRKIGWFSLVLIMINSWFGTKPMISSTFLTNNSNAQGKMQHKQTWEYNVKAKLCMHVCMYGFSSFLTPWSKYHSPKLYIIRIRPTLILNMNHITFIGAWRRWLEAIVHSSITLIPLPHLALVYPVLGYDHRGILGKVCGFRDASGLATRRF